MDKNAEHRLLIEELRRTDRFGSREFLGRLGLVSAGCAIGWFWMELDIIPYWYSAYYGAVLFEKFLIGQFQEATSRRFMAALVAVSGGIGIIFVALPVYLWFRPDPVLHFAALVLLVAGCLNIYHLRARVWPVALAYFIPIGVGFMVMAAGFWSGPHGGAEFWAAIAVAILISAYFAMILTEAHKAHRRMLRTQAHLIASQKIEALETLSAGISHDFRNLLCILKGNLARLQQYPNAAERNACIRDSLAAARSGTELCDHLERYARRIAAAPAMVDPIRVIEDVRVMSRHILPATIQLQTQTPSVMDQFYVDESALQAVLLNLIAHARDATGTAGTISLETYLTAAGEGRGRGKIVFEVGNSGSGRIPDPEAAFDMPEDGSADGISGLALATARGFAEHSGGEFRIEPNLGRGTRILLQLPA